jgi:hypothetical protein
MSSKYVNIVDNVYKLFATPEWKAEKIPTFPSNFDGSGDEFIRVSVIPSGGGINLNSGSGVVLIDIFTSAGKGPKRAMSIADILDLYLVGKSLSTQAGTIFQFSQSSAQPFGADPINPSLYRVQYQISFNYFEVN